MAAGELTLTTSAKSQGAVLAAKIEAPSASGRSERQRRVTGATNGPPNPQCPLSPANLDIGPGESEGGRSFWFVVAS